jgi:hypothetical protein
MSMLLACADCGCHVVLILFVMLFRGDVGAIRHTAVYRGTPKGRPRHASRGPKVAILEPTF